MVWHTNTGDRILEGSEAELYLKLLQDSFVSDLEYNDWQYDNSEDFQLWVSTGNSFFDRASFNQQIVLIAFCLKALLKPDVPMPELDHVLEAAAFYPFAYLKQMIYEEISQQSYWESNGNQPDSDEYTYFYRQIAWDAFEESVLPGLLEYDDLEEEDEPNIFYEQKYKCQDMDDWEFATDCLADEIFWDRDWFFVSTQPQLLDGMEPAIAASMGITENYFTNRLPKVNDEAAMAALKEIMEWQLSES